jgi:hypothetical protein
MNVAEFRIGRVLRQAAAAPWTSIGRWIALAGLVQTPIFFYWLSGLDQHLPEGPVARAIHSAVQVAFSVITQAAVTAAILARLRGQRISLGALLGMTLRPAPLIGFVVAYGLISGLPVLVPSISRAWFGFYPGVGFSFCFDFGYHAVQYLVFAVTVPVLVNERTGVLEALKRSVILTRNHRGRIFGLYLLAYLARALISLPLVLWATWTETPQNYAERYMVWSLVSSLIGPVFWGAVNTSLYRALRLVREGVDIQTTPSVPDARIHAPG